MQKMPSPKMAKHYDEDLCFIPPMGWTTLELHEPTNSVYMRVLFVLVITSENTVNGQFYEVSDLLRQKIVANGLDLR